MQQPIQELRVVLPEDGEKQEALVVQYEKLEFLFQRDSEELEILSDMVTEAQRKAAPAMEYKSERTKDEMATL